MSEDPTTAPPGLSDDELSRARALFQRGVALAEQGQFGPAAQRFREALAIHHAPAVEYNLAAALFALRQYDESFNRIQSVLRDASSPEALRAHADKLQGSLYPYIARLTVTASSTAAEGMLVSVDGQPLDSALMGVARAVAPGRHHVLAERQGRRVSEREVEVPLRTAAIVDVSLVVTEREAAAVPVSGPTLSAVRTPSLPRPVEGRAQDDRSRQRRVWLWTGLAAGLAMAGAGVALAIVLTKDDPAAPPATTGDFMPGVLTWR